jgi:hypothetical protein
MMTMTTRHKERKKERKKRTRETTIHSHGSWRRAVVVMGARTPKTRLPIQICRALRGPARKAKNLARSLFHATPTPLRPPPPPPPKEKSKRRKKEKGRKIEESPPFLCFSSFFSVSIFSLFFLLFSHGLPHEKEHNGQHGPEGHDKKHGV